MPHSAGWFAFPRRLFSTGAWRSNSPAVWRVLTACYHLANYEPKVWFNGREQVQIPVGSFVTSRAKMCEFCSVTEKQFRYALDLLESEGLISTTGAKRFTMITVLECDTYGDENGGQGPEDDRGLNWGQDKGLNEGQNNGPERGQPELALSSSVVTICAHESEARGQNSDNFGAQTGAILGAQTGATTKQITINKNKGEGHSPLLEEAFPHLAIVRPPPSPSPINSEPAALIEKLVRELAKVHPGDVSIPYAIKDALAAFRRSEGADAEAWCQRVRDAHLAWREKLRWRRNEKPKKLGFWFEDEEYERFAPAEIEQPPPAAEVHQRQPEAPQPIRKTASPEPRTCKRCSGSGLAFPEGMELTMPFAQMDADPKFDLNAYWNSLQVPCPDCKAGAQRNGATA